jgi:hypothetical protein
LTPRQGYREEARGERGRGMREGEDERGQKKVEMRGEG